MVNSGLVDTDEDCVDVLTWVESSVAAMEEPVVDADGDVAVFVFA